MEKYPLIKYKAKNSQKFYEKAHLLIAQKFLKIIKPIKKNDRKNKITKYFEYLVLFFFEKISEKDIFDCRYYNYLIENYTKLYIRQIIMNIHEYQAKAILKIRSSSIKRCSHNLSL